MAFQVHPAPHGARVAAHLPTAPAPAPVVETAVVEAAVEEVVEEVEVRRSRHEKTDEPE